MPSPFPGMNPYLEQDDVWEDFHHNFLTWSQRALNSQLGPDYLARVETRVYIRELSESERRYFGRADVALSMSRRERSSSAVAEIGAPVELLLPDVDTAHESWLEIRDRRDRRVITVIALLSPTNKTRGPDRDAYLSKRNGILASRTHLVEIDLRRGGERPALPRLPTCDYYVFISQYESRPRGGFWPISLRERLPVIRIPLSPPDQPVALDLQDLLHQAYDAADYVKTIYAETPDPPLSPADATWAEQFIPALGT
jgi:hypothetical protein